MAIVLGLAVAVAYGAADFFGGLGTRRASLAAVVVCSQAVGLLGLAVVAPLAGGRLPMPAASLAAAAGLVGGGGLAALYRSLATGRMSVVAPITAVGAAVLPVGWGLLRGDRPGTVALFGVAVALVAVAVVSRVPGSETEAAGGPGAIVLSVLAGVAFGVVFVVLDEINEGSGFLPLLVMRVASVTALGLGAIATGRSVLPGRPAVPLIVGAGLLDVTANAFYLLATRAGLLSLVAVLSSLYPAITVLLARFVLHERLGRMQAAGLAMAAAGVVLIAAG